MVDGLEAGIAITGMSCRFAGSESYEVFWRHLRAGRNLVSEIPSDRWSLDGFYSSDASSTNRSISKWGGFIERPDAFDYRFFRVSPREAAQMDPQQRLLLEEAWHALEDASVNPAEVAGRRVGVFVGMMTIDYYRAMCSEGVEVDGYGCSGNFGSILANRISYQFGCTGPSVTIDTACSSSLVAIDQARRSLLSGESDMALVGGVSLNLHPWKYLSLSKARMLSPDGQCKTFDLRANGYVPGDGVAVLVLEPLDKAIRSGRRIHGVLLGSAVNHGGAANSLTAPRVEAQQAVLRAAWKEAGISASSLSYVEAHGTGTSLGDPVEVEALTRAFREETDRRQFCGLGSVKTNIGHLEPCSGLAGMIKVMLMMREKTLVPTLNLQDLNPIIDFASSPFELVRESRPWLVDESQTLRSGVSSFGFGGVNAHVVLQTPDKHLRPRVTVAPVPQGRRRYAFPLSARSADQFQALAERWAGYLEGGHLSDQDLPALSSHFALTRGGLSHRRGWTAESIAELRSLCRDEIKSIPAETKPSWVLRTGALPGGSVNAWEALVAQHPSMGLVRDEICSELGADSGVESLKFRSVVLVGRLLERCLGRPARIELGGDQVGAISGLYLAGMISGEVAEALLKDEGAGGFAAARPLVPVRDSVTSAQFHCHEFTSSYWSALSRGIVQELESLTALIESAGQLVDHQMTFRRSLLQWNDELKRYSVDLLEAVASRRSFLRLGSDHQRAGTLLAVGNALRHVMGKWDLSAWPDVQCGVLGEWLDLIEDGAISKGTALEILVSGSSAESIGDVQRIDSSKPYPLLRKCDEGAAPIAAWLRDRDERLGKDKSLDSEALAVSVADRWTSLEGVSLDSVTELLASVWERGAEVDWAWWQGAAQPLPVGPGVPGYPFEKLSCWVQTKGKKEASSADVAAEEELTQDVECDPQAVSVVADHRIGDRVIIPGAWMAMIAGGVGEKLVSGRVCLSRIHFRAPVMIDERVALQVESAGESGFQVKHESRLVCDGMMAHEHSQSLNAVLASMGSIGDLPLSDSDLAIYQRLDELGFHYGPSLQVVKGVVKENQCYYFHLETETLSGPERWVAILDGMLQGLLYLADREGFMVGSHLLLPAAMEGLDLPIELPSTVMLAVSLDGVVSSDSRLRARLVLQCPDSGRLIGGVEQARFVAVSDDLKEQLGLSSGRRFKSRERAGAAPATGEREANLRELKELLQEVLEVDVSDVSADVDLREFGLDSIAMTEFAEGIEEAFHVTVDPVELFEVPQLSGLLALIMAKRGQAVLGHREEAQVERNGVDRKAAPAERESMLGGDAEEVANRMVRGLESILSVETGEISNDTDLREFGLDSITLTEFAEWLSDEFGVPVDPVQFHEYPNLKALAAALFPVAANEVIEVRSTSPVKVSQEGGDETRIGGAVPRDQETVTSRETLQPDCVTGVASVEFVARMIRGLETILSVSPGEIESDTDLREFGLDSITLTEFAEWLSDEFGISVDPVIFHEYPSLRALSAELFTDLKASALTAVKPKTDEVRDESDGWDGGVAEVERESEAQPLNRSGVSPGEEPETRIAVLGMAGVFPGADSVEELWNCLEEGADCVTSVPANRGPKTLHGVPQQGEWPGGFLRDVTGFDAEFFQISPREANSMDPQQRLALEQIWRTLEDAGIRPASTKGSKTGVFVGVCNHDYEDLLRLNGSDAGALALTGNAFSILANRISYWFDWHGPSAVVDTACSSSLVALHQALVSLRSGECDAALVGGVNLCIAQGRFQSLSEAGMLSPEGRCRTFDAAASGYVRGEGVAFIYLRSLSAAQRDGSRVRGVISGSAVNHGGWANSLTAPNPNAQASLIRDALKQAGVGPESISYIEAHGTGTQLGDPIEVAGLSKAFASGSVADDPIATPWCGLGTIKSNIGHLESAAGIAGIIKAVMAAERGVLPKTLHFNELNSHISLEQSPFFIIDRTQPWRRLRDRNDGEVPRRAGVSSFGFGGANAHVVVEEPPVTLENTSRSNGGLRILPFSAKTDTALRATVTEFVSWYLAQSGADRPQLDDVARTLLNGRDIFGCRLAMIVESESAAESTFRKWLAGEKSDQVINCEATNQAVMGDGPADQAFYEALCQQGDWRRLSALWVGGAPVPPQLLGPQANGRVISMPGYAFQKTSFWMPEPATHTATHRKGKEGTALVDGPSALHLDEAWKQVADAHRWQGMSILPGVSFWVLAAARVRLGAEDAQQGVTTRLHHWKWHRPLSVPEFAATALESESNSQELKLRFTKDGSVIADGTLANDVVARVPVQEDIVGLQERLPRRIEGSELYERFAERGMEYRGGLRRVARLYYDSDLALAEFVAPGDSLSRAQTDAEMLDAALHGVLPLLEKELRGGMLLPVAAASVVFHSSLAGASMSVIRRRMPENTSGGLTVNVALTDSNGNVLAAIDSLAFAEIESGKRERRPLFPIYLPRWRVSSLPEQAINSSHEKSARPSLLFRAGDTRVDLARSFGSRIRKQVFLGHGWESGGEIVCAIDAESPEHFRRIISEHPDLESIYFWVGRQFGATESVSMALFRLLQALPTDGCLAVTVVTEGACAIAESWRGTNVAGAGVQALAQVAAREFPRLNLSILDIESGITNEAFSDGVLPFIERLEPGCVNAWRTGHFWRQKFEEVDSAAMTPVSTPIRKKGVYVILGGSGGVGGVLALRLAREFNARLTIVGRSPRNDGIAKLLDDLQAAGADAFYASADIADTDALRSVLDKTRSRFGNINGVIHAAMVLEDASLRQLTEEQFRRVLRPKVAGLECVLSELAEEPLDWVMLCSSANSFLANYGQANYVLASALHDSLGLRWGAENGVPVKVVNWGLWGESGIIARRGQVGTVQSLGIEPISDDEGWNCFLWALSNASDQSMPLHLGAKSELRRILSLGERVSLAGDRSVLNANGLRAAIPSMAKRLTEESAKLNGCFEALAAYCVGKAQIVLRQLDRDRIRPSAQGLVEVLKRWDEERLASPDRHVLESDYPFLRAHLDLADRCIAHLEAVIRGDMEATEVLFPEGTTSLVEPIYSNNPLVESFNGTVAEAVRVLCDNLETTRSLRILEVGAGTGGTSAKVLEALQSSRTPFEYVYTDVSERFLQAGKKRFGEEHISYRTLDLSQTLREQGFEDGTYDIILGANVVHALPDLDRVLGSMQRLLRPGGVLCLYELTRAHPFLSVTFGLLDGWWLFDDAWRTDASSPLLSPGQWEAALRNGGFKDVDLMVAGRDGDGFGQCVAIATSDGWLPTLAGSGVPALGSNSRGQESAGNSLPGSSVEGDQVALVRDALAHVLQLDAHQIDVSRPFADFGLDSILGIQMVNLLNERCNASLKTSVIFNFPNVRALADHLKAAGLVSIVQPSEEIEGHSSVEGVQLAMHKVNQSKRSKPIASDGNAWWIDAPAGLESLRCENSEELHLGAGEVEVAVEASALNFADLLCVKGLYPNMPPYPFVGGLEFSGRIVALGQDVEGWCEGDRVCGLATDRLGAHASLCRVNASWLARVPDDVQSAEAAALPAVFATAYWTFRRARLQAGETVLIQSAAGGAGSYAVKLALSRGARVYATAGSAAKCEYLRRLGVVEAVNYRQADWVERLRSAVGREGFDIVVNSLVGEHAQKGLDLLAAGGRYVEWAMAGLAGGNGPGLTSFTHNQEFIGLDALRWLRDRSEARGETMAALEAMLKSRAVMAEIGARFEFPDYPKALDFLQSRESTGKLVLEHSLGSNPQLSDVEISSTAEPVAVVGMAGAFPGAKDLEQYWELLREGRCAVASVPSSRWPQAQAWPDENSPGPLCYRGGFLEDVELFDPLFFGMTGREAEVTDPQHRLFLKTAWRALEDAGWRPEPEGVNRCGVFVGCSNGDYDERLALAGKSLDGFTFTGNAASVLASRIAYCLNLKGPAVAIDTACSSSLVAVHSAIQALQSGDCDTAIAGGVFINCTPHFHELSEKAGMLSPSGLCQTFAAGADGFVPGEGVGAVVLRPLSAAKRAGDRILGVIRASGVNQDGATNGMTAPSGESQRELIAGLHQQYQIEPESISYVEAHGTGTALGDPIEVEALTAAFGAPMAKKQFCALGSVKTNIGHAATAAGIASLIKVLLAMRHGQLPPSLHFDQENPALGLAETPFYVNQQLSPWASSKDRPLRASVSSFGFSGTNAHLVVESGSEVRHSRTLESSPATLFVLSAKTDTSLVERVRDLREWVEAHREIPLEQLASAVITKQIHFSYRHAWVVRSVDELLEQLDASGNGKKSEPDPGLTDGKGASWLREKGPHIAANERSQEALVQLAEDYLKGGTFEWEFLYPKAWAGDLMAPGHPFVESEYWVSPESWRASMAIGQTTDMRFRDSDFFVRDHRVHGELVVPGAATLFAALEWVDRRWSKPVSLIEHQWHRRLVAGNGQVDGTLQSDVIAGHYELMADGQTVCAGKVSDRESDTGLERIDMGSIEAGLGQRIAAEQLYSLFDSLGVQYGETFRVLRSLRIGPSRVLAEFKATAEGERWEVPVIDGAFQAVMGLRLAREGESGVVAGGLWIPMSVGRIDRIRPLPRRGYILADAEEIADEWGKAKLRIFDVDGNLCWKLNGLVIRALSKQQLSPEGGQPGLLVPVWTEKDYGKLGSEGVPASPDVLLVGNDSAWLNWDECRQSTVLSAENGIAGWEEALRQLPKNRTLEVWMDLDGCWRAPNLTEVTLLVRSVIREARSVRLKMLGKESAFLEGVRALARSLAWEYPNLHMFVLGYRDQRPTKEDWLAESGEDTTGAILWEHGQRLIQSWTSKYQILDRDESHVAGFRRNGVYWVTGGIGRLSIQVARYLADSYDATVVVSGRREKPSDWTSLCGDGSRLHYLRADVELLEGLNVVRHEITQRFGAITGVIHTAGVVEDKHLLRQSRSDIDRVLGPKVLGIQNLDQVTASDSLDCFVVFSSMAAITGNEGQTVYAAGNGYLDGFVSERNRRSDRHGRALSINWPLWEDGGMTLAEPVRERLLREAGLEPMPSAVALQALDLVVSENLERCVPWFGRLVKASGWLARPLSRPEPVLAQNNSLAGDETLIVRRYLRRLIADEARIPEASFSDTDAFESFGIDSLMITHFNERIEKDLGPISKTLFFEYQNLAALASHFAEKFGDRILAIEGAPANRVDGGSAFGGQSDVPVPAEPVFGRTTGANDATRQQEDRIAIVGMSGRYPGGENLDAYWQALREGQDCVTEIPADRWNFESEFDPDGKGAGKVYAKWGGFLDRIDTFDPKFFQILPSEAAAIDPQERLFLETSFACLEDAGYTRESLSVDGKRSIGVFAGVMWGDYQLYGVDAGGRVGDGLPGSPYWSIANRVSYFCDFQGPSMTVDTACSSSLTAIHLAVESLRRGECSAALAGGVNLAVHPQKYRHLCQLGFASSDGKCRSFGEGGDGYVPGEGVGVVLLKRLDDAIADGDAIRGVILGSSVNHGGKTNGYTVPNPRAQADLIRESYRRSGVDPASVSYLEAHGTGTALGDPIELRALTEVFGQSTREERCALGSVKSNIGHLEAAAGVAALAKVVLQLEHRELVPSLHSEAVNPNLDFEASPFALQHSVSPWLPNGGSGKGGLRRAGISSFGAGGSNAHLILEEAPMSGARRAWANTPEVIVLSARTQEALRGRVLGLRDVLRVRNDLRLRDVARTLQLGREVMSERLAFVAESLAHCVQSLESWLSGETGSILEATQVRASVGADEPGILENSPVELATAWIAGKHIDWNRLDGGETWHRVALPSYPFANESYWVRTVESQNADQNQSSESIEIPERRLYRQVWEDAEMADASASLPAGLLLVLTDEVDEITGAIDKETVGGRNIVFVRRGNQLGQLSDGIFELNPLSRDDWHGLLESLPDVAKVQVLCLWGSGSGSPRPLDFDQTESVLGAWLLLAQALEGRWSRASVDWAWAERGSDLSPIGGAVAGFVQVLQIEYPRYTGRVIVGSVGGEDLIRLAMREMGAGRGDVEIRYQSGLRQVRRQLPVSPHSLPWGEVPLRNGGVYLVTGGLGELGRAFAARLAKRYHAKLVLSGRRPLDANLRSEIRQIEALGGSVLYVQADVSKGADCERLVRAARETFGAIHGVLHAACLVDDGLIFRKPLPEFQSVLRPKVLGTQALDRATSNESLDFFMVFSSLVSVLGNPGQCDYGAACRYQDAFAVQRQEWVREGLRHGKSLSVAWSQWERAGHFASTEMLEQLGVRPLSIERGWEAFCAALVSEETFLGAIDGESEKIAALLERPSSDDTQIAASESVDEWSDEQLNQYLEERVLAGDSELTRMADELTEKAAQDNVAHRTARDEDAESERINTLTPTELPGSPGRDCPQTEPERVELDLVDVVSTAVKERLQLELTQADHETPFPDFGLDSINGVKLADELQERLGREVNPRLFWDYPTINELAAHLANHE